jgi:nucleoside-diphosphate kinase
MIGSTFGTDAAPGTIRGDFCLSKRYNLVHASDSAEAVDREISLFFRPKELLEYDLSQKGWIYDVTGPEPV